MEDNKESDLIIVNKPEIHPNEDVVKISNEAILYAATHLKTEAIKLWAELVLKDNGEEIILDDNFYSQYEDPNICIEELEKEGFIVDDVFYSYPLNPKL